jgi:Fic family protein
MAANGTVVRWREVEPLDTLNGHLEPILATVDSIRRAWEESLQTVSSAAFNEARARSLRRHAIETGIIERIYDVSWGVTEALVAEGLTLEVAAREGGVDERILEAITSQYEALEMLAEVAAGGTGLTAFLVRQIHQALTRTQATYEARNDLGQVLQLPLRHGTWRTRPNHVLRPDGSVLQYTPPEHVDVQMERLTELYAATAGSHPIVRAAWLHHRFICIHPFEDGNGRVARALVLLVLLGAHHAPLVVDRTRRADYLHALDDANAGDLRGLVRLFAELEIVALRTELAPTVGEVAPVGGPAAVARAYAERLLDVRKGADTDRARQVTALAGAVYDRLVLCLEQRAAELCEAFRPLDGDVRAPVVTAAPPDARAFWWRRQIIAAARRVDFFVNLAQGSWWVRLHLRILGITLRYVAVVQKVGHGETGVLALTCFAEILPRPDGDERPDAEQPLSVLTLTSADSVTLVHTDEVAARWPEIEDLVDRTLAAAVAELGATL